MVVPADEVFAMAERFLEASIALKRFRLERWKRLSPKQRSVLRDQAQTLSTLSDQLLNKAIRLVLDDLKESLEAVKGATERATEAVRELKNVADVLAVATGLVALAGAITTENPAAVAAAVADLVATFE
jgi:hypothetical protein